MNEMTGFEERDQGPSWVRANWPLSELDELNLGLDPTQATLDKVKAAVAERVAQTTSDPQAIRKAAEDSIRAMMLIRTYRVRGHLADDLDPLRLTRREVPADLQVGRDLATRQTQRIEIGSQMSAHAIGADQHHGADRILRGFADRLRVAGGLGDALGDGSLDLVEGRLRGVEAEVELVELGQRPVRSHPARTLVPFLEARHFVHAATSNSLRVLPNS